MALWGGHAHSAGPNLLASIFPPFFGFVFGMPFFRPFWCFSWIWAPIWAPFWHHFPYFWHAFFEPRFCIDSVTVFDSFLPVLNHVFYYKTSSFGRFSLFWKYMKFHRFWSPFWHHFGMLLALIFDTFSASIFACRF